MHKKTELIKKILDLSTQITSFAPAMKPFIRQTKDAFFLIDNIKNPYAKKNVWNFDYALQKILLHILKKNATAKEIAEHCIERYKKNLNSLYVSKNLFLDKIKNGKEQYHPCCNPRDSFVYEQFTPGSHILYVGCGSGTECLRYSSAGFRVTGIDTDIKLVRVANQYAQHLNLPFEAVCMDVMKMSFPSGSFDGFMLEFYGNQPSEELTLKMQRELGRVLNPKGKGIVVGSRKKYSSYWFLALLCFFTPLKKYFYFFS
jgi:hypothetical protein